MIKTAAAATLALCHSPQDMSEGRARSFSIAFQRPPLSQLSRTSDGDEEQPLETENISTAAPDGGFGWFVALGQFLIKWLLN